MNYVCYVKAQMRAHSCVYQQTSCDFYNKDSLGESVYHITDYSFCSLVLLMKLDLPYRFPV